MLEFGINPEPNIYEYCTEVPHEFQISGYNYIMNKISNKFQRLMGKYLKSDGESLFIDEAPEQYDNDKLDNAISKALNISIKKIKQSYSILEQMISYYFSPNNHKINELDKYVLLYLLVNNEDSIEYEFPIQKLYVYMLIIYINFKCEVFILNIDEDYMNILLNTIQKTKIMKHLFNLL